MIAAVMGMAFQSCVNDFDDDCNKPSRPGEVKVSFTLRLGDMGASLSRAGEGVWNPSGPSEAGSTFDNFMKMNEDSTRWLHVVFIKENGDLLHLNIDKGYQFNPTLKGYEMIGTLDLSADPDNWEPGEYRVMVLANFRERLKHSEMSKDVHVNTFKTLAALKTEIEKKQSVDWYNKSSDWNNKGYRNAGNVPAIPMWGMTTTTLKLDGNTVDNFSVQLLRSVAKVKIELTPRLKEAGYKLVECSVDALNYKANPLPKGWNEAKNTVDISRSAYDAALNPNSGGTAKNLPVPLPGFLTEYDDEETIVFYLPEWNSSGSSDSVTINLKVKDDLGMTQTCSMGIDNYVLGQANYTSRYSVNRNHLYKFTVDKEITEGELSYKLECWNLVESTIGWNPVNFTFTSGDSEAEYGAIAFPSYPSDKNKNQIANTTSYADYTFTLQSPVGAVWKAFLVEDGVEYSADSTFSVGTGAANTPSGFFFGVGNDDESNNKAASTGIARQKAYNIKVGTRLKAVEHDGTTPNAGTVAPDTLLILNDDALAWKKRREVPTCYLIIKVALDGKNFSETLAINPEISNTGGDFYPYKFAGDACRIQIRQLFPFYKSKSSSDEGRLIKGINNTESAYRINTWWDYPMGYKNGVNTETNP